MTTRAGPTATVCATGLGSLKGNALMTQPFVGVTAASLLVVALAASCTPSTSPSADAASALTDASPEAQVMDVTVP
jgi:hypothetical protein